MGSPCGPRRSKPFRQAPLAVSGTVRLGVEIAFFAFAVFALYQLGSRPLSAIFATAVAIHYAVSYDRIAWLLRS